MDDFPTKIEVRHLLDNESLDAFRPSEGNKICFVSSDLMDCYCLELMSVFARPSILPNLEVLIVEKNVLISRSIFESLACSCVRHLRLCNILIKEEFKVT